MYQGTAEKPEPLPPRPPWTIAISRQAGAGAVAVAQAVAQRLGWPAYDRELIEKVAEDAGLHARLVESVDERRVSWLEECWKGFLSLPGISEVGYARRMTEVITRLGSIGACVIVGRGAPQILPAASTLRVRLVAPLAYRVKSIQERNGLPPAEAEKFVAETDRQRSTYVKDHFHTDAADPAQYDLVLNTSRLGVSACAEVIVAALEQMKGHPAPSSGHAAVAHATT
jgi:cytidylate kinase